MSLGRKFSRGISHNLRQIGKVCLWRPQTFGAIIETRKEGRKRKRKEEKERGRERERKQKKGRKRQGRRGERRQASLTTCTFEATGSLAPMENELTHTGRSSLKGRSWEKSFLYCVVLKTILWPLLFMTWKLWRQGQTPLAPKGARKQKLFTFVPLTSSHPPPTPNSEHVHTADPWFHKLNSLLSLAQLQPLPSWQVATFAYLQGRKP